MTPLLTAWTPEPSVVAGCAALLVARAAADRFRPARAWIPFAAGTAVLFVALASPLDPLADAYSFAAHMVQHMILVLAVPPLWVAGAPAALLRGALRRPALSRLERALASPAVACGLAAAVLALWHVPRLYDAAVASEGLHVVEHLSFLVAFTIYWWPVLAPLPGRRLAAGPAILHLAAGGVATSVVGILVTFSSPALYGSYASGEDPLHVLAALRAAGLDRAADLQLSGLLMWMAGTPVFLGAALGAIGRWIREAERDATLEEGRHG